MCAWEGVAGHTSVSQPAIAWLHLKGWLVSVAPHPNSHWQLSDWNLCRSDGGQMPLIGVFNLYVSDQWG